MNSYQKSISLLVTLLLLVVSVNAQPVLTASVNKSTVGLNEQFKLTYSLNGNGKSFQGPDLKDFNVLGGPNQSSNIQMVNGSFSQSLSFTYFLQPKAEGTFKIGFASIEADGKRIQSNGLILTVVKGTSGNQNQSGQEQGGLSEKNIFLRAEVNKSGVYQGESVTVVFKLYTNVNIMNYTISKSPALNGFWSQDIELPEQLQLSNATVDGINYKVGVLKKVVLFPQQSGTLYIDPMELECIARIQVKGKNRNDPFGVFQNDPFFNDPFFGFGSARDVKYAFKSNKLAINVKALPEGAPESFNGSVGQFNIDASLDKNSTNANEPVSLKIKINGSGNLKLIEPPALEFPGDIESYDAKVNESLKTSESGVSGSKTFEYLLIPRHEGTYELQPVTFSYFDLAKKQYISKSFGPFKIKVGKGNGSGEIATTSTVSKSDFQLLGKDIRYIKINEQEFISGSHSLFGSPLFYVLVLAPFAAFGSMIWYRNRNIALNRDLVSVKSRKATELAKKRLAIAQKSMTAGDKSAFYEEISKAMWGYAGDKLSIPTADLSREKLTSAFQSRSVSEDNVKSFMNIIDECEMARFAGSASADTNGIYQQAIQSITSIEQSLKA